MDELARQERKIYAKVTSIKGTMEEKSEQIQKLGIFEEYNKVHQQYAKLCKDKLEALKRGLFLSWFAMSEPSCFTGIKDLDPESEEKIIMILDKRLINNETEYELDWMLGYYSNWNWVFDQFTKYKAFQNKLVNGTRVDMPNFINHKEMKNRGRMGMYWSSLTIYNK